jgi:hypothetical protein
VIENHVQTLNLYYSLLNTSNRHFISTKSASFELEPYLIQFVRMLLRKIYVRLSNRGETTFFELIFRCRRLRRGHRADTLLSPKAPMTWSNVVLAPLISGSLREWPLVLKNSFSRNHWPNNVIFVYWMWLRLNFEESLSVPSRVAWKLHSSICRWRRYTWCYGWTNVCRV